MRYAVFLDYDDVDYEELKRRAVELSREFGLGKVEVWLSSSAEPPRHWNPHYHLIFERRVNSPEEYRKVMRASGCCEKFARYAEMYESVILRLVGSQYKSEPRLLEVIE